MVRDLYKAELPRTAQEQYDACQHINYEDLKEGDLVFFQSGRHSGVTHVGFYLTNNKFVHASSSNGVIISDLNEKIWRHTWHGAGKGLLCANRFVLIKQTIASSTYFIILPMIFLFFYYL